MLKQAFIAGMFVVFFGMLATAPPAVAGSGLVTPVAKAGGGKWRIAYVEGGYYTDYVPVMKATIFHLEKLGWLKITDQACFDSADRGRGIWQCLVRHVKSDYLEFRSDAFWSANFLEETRRENRKEILARLNGKGDIDLVFAFGTWAGQDLATNDHHVPTVVCSTSDPVASGIIKGPEDSGFDHVHARVDPTRYARQVRLFHDIVGFERLGVVYENTSAGRSYAALSQIRDVAEERGFEIISCNAPFSDVSAEEAGRLVTACHWQLATKIDALYITLNRGVTPENMKQLLEPAFAYNLPTLAMGTLYEVNYGALMSMAQPNFDYAGAFYAETAARILNGEKPRDIPQILEEPQDIRVNRKTAKLIGFHFPVDILMEADGIVEEIQEYQ